MKTRIGFVSNSSTSSFTLVGIVVNQSKINKEFGLKKKDLDKGDYLDYTDFLEELFDGELEIETGIEEYDDDDYIIGKDIHEMKDNQTLKEFKESILKILVDKGWKPNKYSRIEIACDSGYRG